MSMLVLTLLAAGLIGPLDDTIVSTEWLEQNLKDPHVVVVEIGAALRRDHPHIPGARFVAIESIVNREGWPPDELPPVDQLRKAFENAGVGDDGRIVLYSADPIHATRAWFTLDYLGQGDRTAILDGGIARWRAEKRPLATKRIAYLTKAFTPRPDPTRVISHADVRAAVDAGAVLLDARSAREYHGFRRGKEVVRTGHIPGAHCDPWMSSLKSDGTFRSPADLKIRYANLIEKQDARVIVYCRTGMEASMPYLILRSLGYDVVLYDGSYTEWARDKTTEVGTTSLKR